MQLETNPTQNQAELTSKRKKLSELATKEKELMQSLPIDTWITILEREIKELENKSRNQTEEALLVSKKKELAELLAKQDSSNTNPAKPSDKTSLVVGCGVVGLFLVSLMFILLRRGKKMKK